MGGTKLEIFSPKNQHAQRKLLNFENWVHGEVSKVPKFDFQSQFSMSKIIRIFLDFFFIEEFQLRSKFFVRSTSALSFQKMSITKNMPLN